jgi:hypothetical protein
VGSCRTCLKGLCRTCAVDLERGLACRDRCEGAVRSLIATIDQSVRYRGISGGILRTARKLWLGIAVVALLLGCFLTVWGLSLPTFREISLLGVPFLVIGAILLRVVRNLRSAEPPPQPDGGSAA